MGVYTEYAGQLMISNTYCIFNGRRRESFNFCGVFIRVSIYHKLLTRNYLLNITLDTDIVKLIFIIK